MSANAKADTERANIITAAKQADPNFSVELDEEHSETEQESKLGKFIIEIEPGNAAMRTAGDVAEQLRELADRLAHSAVWEGEGPIIDGNGNTVGRWTFHDHN